MSCKFGIGDVVKIHSYNRDFHYNYYTGLISKLRDYGNDEVMYGVYIPEKCDEVYVMECELVKIPESSYTLTKEEDEKFKRHIVQIYSKGTDSFYPRIFLTDEQAYLNEDILRTEEVFKTVGKMIHERKERKMSMTPKKIMRNGPATIVFWEDGTKTVVKKMPGDKDDIYAAFCAAFTKKYFGSNEKVKATVDSLCGPSKEEIDKIVNDFCTKHADDFCKGYGVVAHVKDEKVSKYFIEKLSEMGFSVTKEHDCIFDNNYWLVKRDDTKHIKWCLEHKYFAERLVITPAYTGGDYYRMGEIAQELAEAGYSVKCLYGSGDRDYIRTIEEIEVNRK